MAEDNRSATIREAYRLSEERLRFQVDLAKAADQRAMGFAALMIVATTVIAGLVGAGILTNWAFASVFLLVTSAALAAVSARPQEFYVPGAKFADLSEDIDQENDYLDCISALGKFNDKGSDENNKVMIKNSKFMRSAAVFVLLAMLSLPIIDWVAPGFGSPAAKIQVNCNCPE